MAPALRALGYRRRIVDDQLDALITGGISAISIDGAKAVGKTATAAERADSVYPLEDLPTRELLTADASLIRRGGSVLIDEWQHAPHLWDVVRRSVDDGAAPGQFLLTGSASRDQSGTHSGAGRIVSIRMRPMTLAERGVATPAVSLGALIGGSRPDVTGTSTIDLARYTDEILRSGFPAIHDLDGIARSALLDGYVERIIDRDIADLTGRVVRNPSALRRWLTAYAAATATSTSFDRIRDAATAGDDDKPAKTTLVTYRDILENLHVLDPLPAWLPTRSHIAELAQAPRHHLVDPALAATLLGLDHEALLGPAPARSIRDGTMLGALFESLAVLHLRVAAQAVGARCGHLRTHRGTREIDAIIERRDGRVVAVEVKLSAAVDDADVRHLHWLADAIGDDLLDAVVITTGPHPYRRPDGIAVVPLALLGP